MAVLDQLRKQNLVPSPETVNTNWSTESASLDDRQGPFSLFIKYENGLSVNMVVQLEMSPTGESGDWAVVDDSERTITDSEGMVYYDVKDSGAQFIRISIVVTAGSIDVYEGEYSAFKAHQ